MGTLIDRQLALNRTTLDRWAEYASHRERITRWLLRLPLPESSRLCVLGAGNVNDLDLSSLLTSFAEIRLVDLDESSPHAGVARQGLDGEPRVTFQNADITGVFDRMETWSPASTLEPTDLDAAANSFAAVAESIGSFEAAASLGLLSQLMAAVVQAVGETHPQFLELLQAVRIGHLRVLAQLTAPAGTGVLVTDVVSSDTSPDLANTSEADLPRLISGEVQRSNFFHGVNPFVLETLFHTDPFLASRVEHVASLPPWKWNLGPRIYATCGFAFRARA